MSAILSPPQCVKACHHWSSLEVKSDKILTTRITCNNITYDLFHFGTSLLIGNFDSIKSSKVKMEHLHKRLEVEIQVKWSLTYTTGNISLWKKLSYSRKCCTNWLLCFICSWSRYAIGININPDIQSADYFSLVDCEPENHFTNNFYHKN